MANLSRLTNRELELIAGSIFADENQREAVTYELEMREQDAADAIERRQEREFAAFYSRNR